MQKTKVDSTLLKNVNRKKILSVIDKSKNISRVEIKHLLGKNGKTVTNITNGLIADGLVISKGFSEFTGGRRREILSINQNYGYLIGLQLGIYFLKGIVTDFNYNIIAEEKRQISPKESKKSIIKKIISTIDFLIESGNISEDKLLGIGFVANGFYNKENGVWILSANNPKWKNVPIKSILSELYKVPIYLESISGSLAIWEKLFGKAKSFNNMIYLDISKVGIGCAITNHGRLYKGVNNKAGEFGHTIVVPNGEVCTCGNKGCLETVASGWAIMKKIKESIKKGKKTILTKIYNDNLDKLDFKTVFDAYYNGDKLVTEILDSAGNYLSLSIANLINLFNPGVIVLGGYVATCGQKYLSELKHKIQTNTLPLLFKDVKIIISSLNDNSSVLGAAALVRDPFFHIDSI